MKIRHVATIQLHGGNIDILFKKFYELLLFKGYYWVEDSDKIYLYEDDK